MTDVAPQDSSSVELARHPERLEYIIDLLAEDLLGKPLAELLEAGRQRAITPIAFLHPDDETLH